MGKVIPEIDSSLFQCPSNQKPTPASKVASTKPAKRKATFLPSRRMRKKEQRTFAVRGDFVEAIFGDWSKYLYLYVFIVTLHVCRLANFVLEADFTLTPEFFERCRSGELVCMSCKVDGLISLDNMDDDQLAMFEFVENRRLEKGEGIPFSDVSDEMKRQNGEYL